MCNEDGHFEDRLSKCFDPLEGDQIEFGTLIREIFEVTAIILLIWLCMAASNHFHDQWEARESTSDSRTDRGSGEGGYEEVPLANLGAGLSVTGDASSAAPPAADEEEEEEEERSCRICKDEEGELLSPCKCSGSGGYVHAECLQKWVETKSLPAGEDEGYGLNLTCEICLSEYDVTVVQRFVCDKERLCGADSWSEYCNCILLVFILPLIFFAMWMSCTSETEALTRGESLCREEGHWTIVAIGVLLCLTFIATIQKVTLRWWHLNNEVILTGR